MADTDVTLNQNVTAGANVAVYQDTSGFVHQKMILETQTPTSDPVKVNATNPLPVAGATADLTTAPGNSLKVAGVYNAAAPAPTTGQMCALQLDASGNLNVNIQAGAAAGGTSSMVDAAIPSSATAIGASDGTDMQLLQVDGSGNLKINVAAGGVPAGQDNTAFTASTTQGITGLAVADQTNAVGAVTQGNMGTPKMTLDRKLFVAIGATTTGGWSPKKITSTAAAMVGNIKASAGQLGYFSATNTGAGFAYVKFYNTAGTPTAGAGTPVAVFGLPPGGGGYTIQPPGGVSFSTGIGFAITGGTGADTDTTAVLLSQVNINVGYA